jgi:hypothetical protein
MIQEGTFNITPSKLQINGLGGTTDTSHLPISIRGTGDLWDVVNDKITPISEGDSYDLRVSVGVTGKTGSPSTLIFKLDIGGGAAPTIVIAEEDKAVTKAPPYDLIFTFPYFTLNTFLTNGGQMFLSTDTGSLTIGSRKVLIARTSSGVA